MDVSYIWNFGPDRMLSKTLIDLVLSGKKTASTGLYKEGDVVPKVGSFAGIQDLETDEVHTIQYINVEIKPFLAVEYDYIKKEGEGDKTVEEWREKHRTFFHLTHDDVVVVCEEFVLVSPS